MRSAGVNGELSCECLVFEFFVNAEELCIALGRAVHCSGLFVCFSSVPAEVYNLSKSPKMNFWWAAKVLAAGLVSCN